MRPGHRPPHDPEMSETTPDAPLPGPPPDGRDDLSAPGSRAGGSVDPVDAFVRRLRRVLAEPQIAARVAAAGITVRIDLTDAPGRSVALLLDRMPPVVEDAGPAPGNPTVRLMLDSHELDALLHQGSHLPMAILDGAVTFEGSVRKFLRVMPILRGGALRFDTDDEFEAGR